MSEKVENTKDLKVANKEKKPNIFKRMGKKIKDIVLELKKVSWPSFGKVVKQTGVVLAVVLFILVIISVADFGLAFLLEKLTGSN